jgi:hypothetical protein
MWLGGGERYGRAEWAEKLIFSMKNLILCAQQILNYWRQINVNLVY